MNGVIPTPCIYLQSVPNSNNTDDKNIILPLELRYQDVYITPELENFKNDLSQHGVRKMALTRKNLAILTSKLYFIELHICFNKHPKSKCLFFLMLVVLIKVELFLIFDVDSGSLHTMDYLELTKHNRNANQVNAFIVIKIISL